MRWTTELIKFNDITVRRSLRITTGTTVGGPEMERALRIDPKKGPQTMRVVPEMDHILGRRLL